MSQSALLDLVVATINQQRSLEEDLKAEWERGKDFMVSHAAEELGDRHGQS